MGPALPVVARLSFAPGCAHSCVRLMLSSEDCVRFGLVKGCVCTIRAIIHASLGNLDVDVVLGEPHSLQYMPASLLLQAESADWTLPRDELPVNPPESFNRRGLFQLRPQRRSDQQCRHE